MATTVNPCERKHADTAVWEGEERYRALCDRSLDCVYLHDFEGRFLDANPAALSLLGYGREEILSLSFASLLDEGQMAKARRALAELKETGGQRTPTEFRLRRKSGEHVYVETKSSVVFHDGKPFAVQGVGRDITARKHAEDALRRSEERCRHLVESAHDWFWETDERGLYTFASPKVLELLGFEPEEVLGKSPFDLMPPDEAKRVAALIAPVIADHKPFRDLENVNRGKDGRLVVLETNGVPVFDHSGNFCGYRGMDRDISERKRAEEALRQSETLLRTTVESAPLVLTMLDSDGIVLLSMGAGLEKLHKPGEELVGQSIFDVCKNNPVIVENVRRALAGETVHYATEIAGVDFDSSIRPVLDSTGEVKAVVGISADVTERKAAEEALRLSYAEVRRLHLGNLKALSAALSVKDHYTLGHAARVSAYMVLLGHELGWSEERLLEVQDVAYLHDIGKIAISDRVLLKAGPLNHREWELMRQHPAISAEIVGPLFDEELAQGVRHHHEHFDGSGYPDGLAGETIPLIARAMCVVDGYDAMSCVRPYRPALTYRHCQEELHSRSGTQFDPEMVEAFLRALASLESRRRPLAALAAQAATLIDPEQHKLLRSRADEARPEYREMVTSLRALRDSHPDVHFITTFAQVGNTCVTVLDTGETAIDSSHIGDQWLPDDELAKVLIGEKPDVNVLDADEFGVWITGVAPIRDASGAVTAAVCVDVPAVQPPLLQRFHTDLSHGLSSVLQAASIRWSRAELEAITDGLTGLYNHRYIQERLEEEMERAGQQNGAVTLLFADLDEFKAYNDACGHTRGDEALRSVSQIIEGSVRHMDLAARYGGEEFLIVLVGAGLSDALQVAERMRAQVAAVYEGGQPALTISIGVATFPADARGKNELLDKADWALYAAKRSGRNRVVAFSEGLLREGTPPHGHRQA